MGPSGKPVDRSRLDEEKPDIAEGTVADAETPPGGGDQGEGLESAVRPGAEADGSLPEEDDDNPDQESDEALPDDDEEHAIRNDMSGRGIRYKPE